MAARRSIVRAIALVIFVGSFLLRLLELQFHNDHFEFISLGAEILDGAVPGIDFFDPARPLQYYLSAAGLLFGHQLVAEAILSITLISVGTALVFVAGVRLSGSMLLGVLSAVFTGAMLPRLYSYPKIIIPVVILLAFWRYVEKPSRPRLATMCLATAVAFYFRFDHGVWVGIATVAGLAALNIGRWNRMAADVLAYGGGVALLCAPAVLFLYAAGGGISSGPGTGRLTRLIQGEDVVSFGLPRIPEQRPLVYLRPPGPLSTVRWSPEIREAQRAALERQYSLRFARFIDEGAARQYVLTDLSASNLKALRADPAVVDATNVTPEGRVLREPPWSVVRRWLRLPVIESPLLNTVNASIWLYDALFLTPFAAAVLLIVRLVRHRTRAGEAPMVSATIVLSLVFNIFLIRGNLDSRLSDVIVPAALLWAWMLRSVSDGVRHRPMRGGAIAWSCAAAVVTISIWTAVDVYAGSMSYLAATELFSTPVTAARHLKGALVNLRRDPLEQFAPAGSTGLRALTRYVNRCTSPADRLLVLGYQPEVFFYADRRIGGGNAVYHANLASAPEQQEFIVSRLKRERVPIVILPVDQAEEIEAVYPILKRYVDSRYVLAKESGFGEGRPIRVLVDRQVVARHTDAELGLPCFVGSG